MTSKERAKLKSVAANTETIMQIGKNPINDAGLKQIDDALNARELIKIRVLETCEMLPPEAAQAICGEIRCEIVQVIGSRIVLFRKRSAGDKKPSLLEDAKPEKSGSGDNAKNRSAGDASKKKAVKGVSGRERKPQKNEQYKGNGQNRRGGSGRSGQKNGKKSGNIRRGF